MTIGVAQWATGAIGRECLRFVMLHPELELVGVRVYSDDKNGTDAGDLVGLPRCGVLATTNRDEIINGDADVVVYAALITSDNRQELHQDVVDLLAAGKNVVCTGIEFDPSYFGEHHLAEVEEAMKAGASSLAGSGIHPGFLFDRMGVALTGLCARLDRIEFAEIFDCSQHPSPSMVFGQMGMGSDPESLTADSDRGRFYRELFCEDLSLAASRLGLVIDDIDVTVDLGLATRDLDLVAGHIDEGKVAGVRWLFTGFRDGEPRISIEENWYVDRDLPDWEKGRFWRVVIEGEPSLRMTTEIARTWGDRHAVPWYDATSRATASGAVRAVKAVFEAPTGLFRPPIFAPYDFRTPLATARA
jgi:2,4-diaminopentanoate dehydrogenase